MIIAAGLHFLIKIHIFDSLPASSSDAGFCAIHRNIYKLL
jgi:hypothetical protein